MAKMQYCPKCGSVLYGERATCYYCAKGKDAKISKFVREYQDALRKANRMVLTVVVAFIALSAAAAIYWLLKVSRHN